MPPDESANFETLTREQLLGQLLEGFFDDIVCINLDCRPDRWKYVQQHFRQFGLADRVRRFSAIDLRGVPEFAKHQRFEKERYSLLAMAGCLLSHRTIVEQSFHAGLRNVLVLEDDVKFLSENISECETSLRQLSMHPWEIFYFGATYDYPLERVDSHLLRVPQGAMATHAIAYNQRCFRKLLDLLPASPEAFFKAGSFEVNAVDVWLSSDDFDHHHFYASYPLMAVQGLGNSDISTKQVDQESMQKMLFEKMTRGMHVQED